MLDACVPFLCTEIGGIYMQHPPLLCKIKAKAVVGKLGEAEVVLGLKTMLLATIARRRMSDTTVS